MKNMNGMMKAIQINNTLKVLQFSGLSGICNISHFITTRQGGVSKGAYASMNPGMYSGDDLESVWMNLEILSKGLGVSSGRIFFPHQVHGVEIRTLDAAFLSLSKLQQAVFLDGADALVTDRPGVCVSVSTADCVPVLLYAPDKHVVAAVHAGWRGTVQRIVEATVAVMADKYGCDPSCMFAGIAPSICKDAFEVGDEVVEAFRLSGVDMDEIACVNPSTGKAHIDLWEANHRQLMHAGVPASQIEVSGFCTYTDCDTFFSARRLGIKSGRILSGIMINERCL